MDDGPPLFSADSSCPRILWIPLASFCLRLRGSHTLRRAFPCASTDSGILFAVRTPAALLLPVWPLPLSLATTRGISFDFSSSGYLDVSVPRVPRIYLWIQYMLRGSSPRGFPHSDIRGSKLICSSPRLFAACHVLRRLPMPRHSPYALLRLNSLTEQSVLGSSFFARIAVFHTCSFFGKIVFFYPVRKNLIFRRFSLLISCFPYFVCHVCHTNSFSQKNLYDDSYSVFNEHPTLLRVS